jgi:hypothetical protein
MNESINQASNKNICYVVTARQYVFKILLHILRQLDNAYCSAVLADDISYNNTVVSFWQMTLSIKLNIQVHEILDIIHILPISSPICSRPLFDAISWMLPFTLRGKHLFEGFGMCSVYNNLFCNSERIWDSRFGREPEVDNVRKQPITFSLSSSLLSSV